MTSKSSKIIIFLVIIVLAGAGYWFYSNQMDGPSSPSEPDQNSGGFVPLNRPGGFNQNPAGATTSPQATATSSAPEKAEVPVLRLLSSTPVGGYSTITTASTTVIRWIDRGRGNILEAKGNDLEIATLSNTVVPRIYVSVWNKDLTSFIGSTLEENSAKIASFYAQLSATKIATPKTATTSTSTATLASAQTLPVTPFELKGKGLPQNVVSFAVSPKRDQVLLFTIENGNGVGYISSFDGKSVTKLFETPMTQLNVDWPEATTVSITTKGASTEQGYMYFINTKTGAMKKILGPVFGLSTKVSRDAKRVIFSSSANDRQMQTSILDVGSGKITDAVIRTLADKCAWGNFYKSTAFCSAPNNAVSAALPEDWYKGAVSFKDKIWQVDAETGEVHLVSSVTEESGKDIDAFNLDLDAKDDYLVFMNKNDLSLWSLDLVSASEE